MKESFDSSSSGNRCCADVDGKGSSSISGCAVNTDSSPRTSSLLTKPEPPQGGDMPRVRRSFISMTDQPTQQENGFFSHRQNSRSSGYKTSGSLVLHSTNASSPVVNDQNMTGCRRWLTWLAGHSTTGQLSALSSYFTSSSILEDSQLAAEDREDSDSEGCDALSECSMETTTETRSGSGLLSCLRLHPAHPCALVQPAREAKFERKLPDLQQPVSFPGCFTAKQLAEAAAAAEDLRLGELAENFNFVAAQGKLVGATKDMTISVDLVCSELATGSLPGDFRQCVIAIVPRSEQPEEPVKSIAEGWLFTCPTDAKAGILELFGQNGGVRQKLQDCFNLLPGEELGSGTFGSIIRASCLNKPGREIAVKMMKKKAKETAIKSDRNAYSSTGFSLRSEFSVCFL
eukprot:TRINITY_DN9515_c0_g3_i2.p1 TRINITY_DN9515_c0_g3~~TRINITY_DN9515_c0_g3_i2.p1  ORF type:complete len:402 (-),score=83.86 TRINITY_DN9515_c0_g3_i2:249-1454(-)